MKSMAKGFNLMNLVADVICVGGIVVVTIALVLSHSYRGGHDYIYTLVLLSEFVPIAGIVISSLVHVKLSKGEMPCFGLSAALMILGIPFGTVAGAMCCAMPDKAEGRVERPVDAAGLSSGQRREKTRQP